MASTNLARGMPAIKGNIPAFIDFSPDLDPATPGAILDISNMYPTVKGWRTYPGLVKYSKDALPSACLGAFSGFIGSTPVIAAGISGQLYLLSNLGWVSQALSLSPTTGRWRFAIHGNHLIAVDGVNPPQSYTGSGTFAALGGSPPTASIAHCSDFSLFLIEPNSTIWHSSLSATIWTDAIATETVTGSLDSTGGNITAAHQLRGGMAMYKRRALHYATFEGPPFFWNFRLVSEEIGAPSQESVANIGDLHLFPGPNDFYQFDGYSLNPIPNYLREWFFSTLDQNYDANITSRWDQEKSLVFWHFPSINASPLGSLDSWICFNLKTGKWSKGSESIDTAIFAAVRTGQLTYASIGLTYPTYGDLTGVYSDLQGRTVDISGVIKSSDHALYLYNGNPGQAYLTTHDLGDRDNFYQCSRVRPHFAIRPSSATLQALNQKDPGTNPVAGATATLFDGRFNFINTTRLQRFKIAATDEMELTGLDALVEFAGEQ